jgi:hypothetical protein
MTIGLKESDLIFREMQEEYTQAQKTIDEQLTNYLSPMRGAFNLRENRQRYIMGQTILNSHPISSVDKCAAGFQSYLSDQTKTWFTAKKMNGEVSSDEAAEWLSKLSDDIRLVLETSNIYEELTNVYKEFNVYGRGVFMVSRDFDSVVRAYSFTAGSYYLGKDQTGRINSFACKQRKRCNQLVNEFGLANVSNQVKQAWDNNTKSMYFTYNWLIIPNPEKDDGKLDYRAKEWISLKWIEGDSDKYLEVKGFDYFPVVIASVHPIDSTQIYGGEYPGIFALPEARELQEMQRDLNRINGYNSNPTWISHGIADYSQLIPGGVIQFDTQMAAVGGGQIGMTPAIPFRDPTYLAEEIRKKELKIDSIFYVDLFQLLKTLGPNRMTAYEVNRRYSEMIESVGPIVKQLQTALQAMLDVVLKIMLSTKVYKDGQMLSLVEARIGQIPNELAGTEVKFKFVGILAMLQKASEMLPMEQLVQFLTYLRSSTQGAAEDPMDWLDIDDIVRKYAANLGAEEHLKGVNDVEELRELRSKAMAEEQQRADAMQTVQAAQALANTPMGQQSAVGAITGNPVGGQ